jgi:hypothetical protein
MKLCILQQLDLSAALQQRSIALRVEKVFGKEFAAIGPKAYGYAPELHDLTPHYRPMRT